MFLRLVAVLMISLSSAFATDWIDLNFEDNYKLTKKIVLLAKADNQEIVLSKNEDKWKLFEVIPLSMINVDLYRFEWLECRKEVETDMVIIDPRDFKNDPSVGVQLDNCYLEVFVELKDIKTLSLFR